MHSYNRFILLALFFGLQISIVSAQMTEASLEEKVDEICNAWKGEGPGGVIGIVKDGKLVFSKAYGMASLEYKVPNTTQTIFNIASVSKQFTAYSMVLLEQQGKLKLDDDIRTYLPEIPDFGTPITIRHLLNHISGLRNFQNLLGIAGWRQGDSMTNEDLLRFMSQQKELNFPVGSEYLYCNSGFVLVTFIVERVTGMSFQDWTKEHIFLPLGMNNTSFREDMEAVHLNSATSYARNDDGTFRQPLKYWTYMGNGNVYTSIEDMAKWVQNFSEPELGGSDGINSLTEKGILTNGDTLTYALGIGVSEYRGQRRFSHGGSVGGYRSNFVYFPDLKTGIVAFANYSAANPGGKVYELVDYYLEDHLGEKEEEEASVYQHLTSSVEIPAATFEKSVGAYLVEGVNITISYEDGHQQFQAQGYTPKLPLMAASDTSFFVPGAQISLFMLQNDEEAIDRFILLRNDDRMTGYKVDPELADPEVLRSYTGTYYSPEVDTEYHMKIEDEKLVAYHQRHGTVPVHPIQMDYLRGEAFHLRDIRVERWANGDIKGIKVSNGRVRDLWFEKK